MRQFRVNPLRRVVEIGRASVQTARPSADTMEAGGRSTGRGESFGHGWSGPQSFPRLTLEGLVNLVLPRILTALGAASLLAACGSSTGSVPSATGGTLTMQSASPAVFFATRTGAGK